MLPSGVRQAFRVGEFQRRLWAGDAPQDAKPSAEEVFRRTVGVLNRLQVRWALAGAHAVNAYVRPRATADVDLIVDARRIHALVAALEQEFGALETVDIGAAVRIATLDLDLIRSDNHALFREALDRATDRGGVPVPPADLLIVLKFLAAVSPWRNPADRQQDAADMIRLYQKLREQLDAAHLLAIAARAYPGAERELAAMLERIDRGEPLAL